jgi:hypothetical protein
MLPKKHFLYGLIAALILVLLNLANIWQALIFVAATVLMDFDHYIYYVRRKRKYNLRAAYHWFKIKEKFWKMIPPHDRKHYYTGFYIFHGIEWVVLFLLLGYFLSSAFYYVALGMLFHLVLDWLIQEIYLYPYRFKFSIIYDYLRFKKLRLIE